MQIREGVKTFSDEELELESALLTVAVGGTHNRVLPSFIRRSTSPAYSGVRAPRVILEDDLGVRRLRCAACVHSS